MHDRRVVPFTLLLAAAVLLLPVASHAQSFNGSVSGTVVDPSGSPVPGADLVLKNTATGVELQRTSETERRVRLPQPPPRQLRAARDHRRASSPTPTRHRGAPEQRRPPRRQPAPRRPDRAGRGRGRPRTAATTAARTRTASRPTPCTSSRSMFSSGPRSSATFVLLMPGVTTGGSANAFDARINGGLQSGDEAVLDGASMQQGFMSQSGMVVDLPGLPVLAGHGERDQGRDLELRRPVRLDHRRPDHGRHQVRRSKFHGAVFEYLQNDALNANQWGATEKSPLKKHNFGGNVGGPMKIPGLWSNSVKTYFYVDVEGYRQKGGATRSTLSIPSLKERAGDFSDWRDANGNLIPIYDPATTQVRRTARSTRAAVPGQHHPGQPDQPASPSSACSTCPTRRTTARSTTTSCRRRSPTRSWATATTSSAGSTPTSARRTTSSSPSGTSGPRRSSTRSCRTSSRPRRTPTPRTRRVNRLNWDHTFSPNLLNHMTFGYLNRNEGYGCVNADVVDKLPKIAGVAGYNVPPDDRLQRRLRDVGLQRAASTSATSRRGRPTSLNDLVTWIKGSHTIKIGGEYRNIGGNIHANGNQAGSFNFGRGGDRAPRREQRQPDRELPARRGRQRATWTSARRPNAYPRQTAWIFHAGDTWNVNSKLTAELRPALGLLLALEREVRPPLVLRPERRQPVGRRTVSGALAFAGSSCGRGQLRRALPGEELVRRLRPAPRRELRAQRQDRHPRGLGHLLRPRRSTPDWGGGMNQDGFNSNVAFSSSLGGLEPAFYLQDGFPQDFTPPPFIQSRLPTTARASTTGPGRRTSGPRSQQWNLTVDRELVARASR